MGGVCLRASEKESSLAAHVSSRVESRGLRKGGMFGEAGGDRPSSNAAATWTGTGERKQSEGLG